MILSLRTGVTMTGDREYLEELIAELEKYGNVFDEVWIPTAYSCPSLENCKKITEDIKNALELFKSHGIVPSIQISRTMGHAPMKLDMEGIKDAKHRILTILDDLSPGRYCHNDEGLRKYVYEACKIYAESKPEIVWIDDDVRIRRPTGGGNSLCFCEACLEKYNKRYGHNFTYESIKEPFTNDVEIRREYIKFQTETLGEFAGLIAKAFKEVSPDSVMALQTGADITLATDANAACLDEMYKISGKAPALRAGGGFYYDHIPELIVNKALKVNYAVSRVPDYVEMISSEVEDLPFLAYGKSNDTPCIEAALFIAYGCNMASITLMHAVEDMSFYAKLFKKLQNFKPYLEKVVERNGKSKNGGVVIYQSERAAERVGEDAKYIWDNSVIYNGVQLTRLGIPIHCGSKGTAYILASDAVDALVPQDIEELLRRPVITDGAAIEKLVKRGYGDRIGVSARMMPAEYKNGVYTRMTDHKVNEGLKKRNFFPNYYFCKDDAYIIESDNMEVVSEYYPSLGGDSLGASTAVVKTSEGAKWAVKGIYLTGNIVTFSIRNQLVNLINYISDEKIPAYLGTEEQVMVIPRVDKNGKTVSVTLFNSSQGSYDDLELIINNPANEKECTLVSPYEEDKKCSLTRKGDSFSVKIDNLDNWRIKTILL